MAQDLLEQPATSNDTASSPVNTDNQPKDLFSQPEPQINQPVEQKSVYLTDKGITVGHPADMSHDQVNDAIQTDIYNRPRNKFFDGNFTVAGEALKTLTGGLPTLAADVGEHIGENEPQLPAETGKAVVRGMESLPKGFGGVLQWFGENLQDQAKVNDPEYQKNLATQIGTASKELGDRFVSWSEDRQTHGFEAPDPDIFRGSFVSNPSFTRLAAGVAEGIPSLAAASALTLGTGMPLAGAAALGLVGGGEAYTHARENGSDVSKASGLAMASTVGNTILMSLPLGKLIEGRLPAGRIASSLEEAATFAGVTGVMTPFNNIIAKIGGDRSRQLFDGMTESILAGAISGGVLGGLTPGRGTDIDGMIQEAHKAGVTPKEIDNVRETISKQMTENPDAIQAAIDQEAQKVNPEFDKTHGTGEIKLEPSQEPSKPAEEIKKPELETGAGKPPESGFVVANIGADGKIYYGNPGDLHFMLSERYSDQIRESQNLKDGEGTWKDVGFADSTGTFFNRKDAAAQVEGMNKSLDNRTKELDGDLDAMALRETVGSNFQTPNSKIFEEIKMLTEKMNNFTTKGEAVPDSLTKRRDALVESYKSLRGNASGQPIPGIKQAINERVGLKDTSPKVTMTEQELLKLRLSSEARAAKYGYKAGSIETRAKLIDQMRYANADIQSVKDTLVQYAKDNLPLFSRGKFIQMAAKAENQLDLIKAFSRIDKEAENVQRSQIVKKIKKMSDDSNDSARLAIDYKEKIKDVLDNFDLKNRQADTVASLKATKKFIDEQQAAGRDVSMPRYVYDSLKILEKKPLAELSIPELESIHDDISLLKDLGETKQASREAVYQAQKDKILKEIQGQGARKITKAPDEKIFHAIQNQMQLMDLSMMPMDAFFDYLDGSKGFQGSIYKNFKARMDMKFGDFLSDYYDKVVPEITDKANNLGLQEENMERISKFATAQQEGGLEKLENIGISRKDALAITLDPKEQEIYNMMRKRLNERHPLIEKQMRDVYNLPLGTVKNYFPFTTDFEKSSESEVFERLYKDSPYAPLKKNAEQGFTKSRIGSGEQKIKLNALDVYMSHMKNVSWLLNMGSDIKMLQEIAGHPEFGEMAGDRGQWLTREWLDLMARRGGVYGDQRLGLLDGLRKNISAGMIGFKIGTALLHVSLLGQGASVIGPDYATSGLKNVAFSREWRDFLWNNMPEIKHMNGNDPAFLDFDQSHNLWEKMQAGSMLPIRKIVGATGSAIAAGAYEKYMKENGLPVDLTTPNRDAIQYAEMAVRRAQGGGQFKDIPLIMSKGIMSPGTKNPSLSKFIFQFQNPMFTKWSLMRHEMMELGIKQGNVGRVANVITWLALANLGATGIRQVSRDALASMFGGTAPADHDDLTAKTIKGFLESIPFVSQAVSAFTYGGIPVPALSVLEKAGEAAHGLSGSRSDGSQAKGAVKLAGAIATLLGVPGASQIGQIAEDKLREAATSGAEFP